MSNSHTWEGVAVRHLDGRLGTITSEFEGFLHVMLTISVHGGGDVYVQLNSNSKDSGDAGWAWYCPNFAGGPAWLPLGDHNDFGVQSAQEAAA
jgi:hypothetical protein